MAGAKSEFNLQQLKHFHTLLRHVRMLEIAFPRTKLSKFPGGACPGTPPRYSRLRQALFELLNLHQDCGSYTGPDLEIFWT